jgi:hypothetical protein
MLEGKGRIINRPTQTGGKAYDKFFIYVPTEIVRDSLFPFKVGEAAKIKIDNKNKRLLIERLE